MADPPRKHRLPRDSRRDCWQPRLLNRLVAVLKSGTTPEGSDGEVYALIWRALCSLRSLPLACNTSTADAQGRIVSSAALCSYHSALGEKCVRLLVARSQHEGRGRQPFAELDLTLRQPIRLARLTHMARAWCWQTNTLANRFLHSWHIYVASSPTAATLQRRCKPLLVAGSACAQLPGTPPARSML